jgi:hypothetical protein
MRVRVHGVIPTTPLVPCRQRHLFHSLDFDAHRVHFAAAMQNKRSSNGSLEDYRTGGRYDGSLAVSSGAAICMVGVIGLHSSGDR